VATIQAFFLPPVRSITTTEVEFSISPAIADRSE
jgi:hypothetical protein